MAFDPTTYTVEKLEAVVEEWEAEDAFQNRYWSDPVGFVQDCFDWSRLRGKGAAPYQLDAISRLPIERRVCVRAPHGVGKTALAAWVVLWFALTRDGHDWKVVTTAGAWRQLTKYLWPEIAKWSRFVRWDIVGRSAFSGKELFTISLKLKTGEAFAAASSNPELIEGAHADHILYVYDESKAIENETFDATEGGFSTGDAYALAISTPGAPVGRFYDIQSRKVGYEDWWVKHITLTEAIDAGRISREWAEQRARQWTVESSVYQNRVLGNFAADDVDSVIPLSYIERANELWYILEEVDGWEDYICAGGDVARSGHDTIEIARRYLQGIRDIESHSKLNTMETAGRFKQVLDANGGYFILDVIGLGAGVYDRMRELNLDARPFHSSEKTDATDSSGELGFINKRAAAWWGLRERLDPQTGEGIALPPSDELLGDLIAPKWKVTSTGKIQIESKDSIKERLGRSPNKGDAVIYAFWDEVVVIPEREQIEFEFEEYAPTRYGFS